MNDTVITEVKDALKGMETKFATAMSGLETFKTELAPKMGKLDSIDEAKMKKISDFIGEAAEESQKLNGKLKAAEEAFEAKTKALETELTQVKTALNRPSAVVETPELKAKEISLKRKKLFNDFARHQDDENKIYFDNFLKRNVTDEAEFKAMSVNSEPNGGYLVVPEFGGVITTKVYESSPIRQLASVITIGTDTYEVILDNDQNTSGWVGETATRSDTTTPTLGKLSITVNELYTQPKASQKMLDDSTIDIESWLAGKAGEEFGRKEATAFVSGNGVMQPKGFLSYASGTDLAAQQIEQVNSGSAGAFTYSGLVSLQSSLKEQYQANATFLLKRATIASIMTIVDGQSRPIFNMMFDKNVGLEPTIMGRSARFANDMPAVASAALAMAYGDFREAYQIVDRAGIRVLRDPFTDKPNVRFYTTKRVGGGVKNFEAIKLHKLT
ncbi:phage major capsid protein [Tundrisphaera lichenicola]|uniref:phage major capsid protein n=1 Tax=Tundrisphaera lichenicola TaxID=2029860 RepID=UPI003EBF966D